MSHKYTGPTGVEIAEAHTRWHKVKTEIEQVLGEHQEQSDQPAHEPPLDITNILARWHAVKKGIERVLGEDPVQSGQQVHEPSRVTHLAPYIAAITASAFFLYACTHRERFERPSSVQTQTYLPR